MRAGQYLSERKIGLETLNSLCDYLRLDKLKISSKLSESKIALIDEALNSQGFLDWLQIRLSLDKMEIDQARDLLKPLFYSSTVQIDDLLGERILNALSLLIEKSYYRRVKESLLKILTADKTILDKISLLKMAEPFSKPPASLTSLRTAPISYKSYDTDYDPYENFHWGGLSGEEAYIGYWNTD
jgi:hypothetical protein